MGIEIFTGRQFWEWNSDLFPKELLQLKYNLLIRVWTLLRTLGILDSKYNLEIFTWTETIVPVKGYSYFWFFSQSYSITKTLESSDRTVNEKTWQRKPYTQWWYEIIGLRVIHFGHSLYTLFCECMPGTSKPIQDEMFKFKIWLLLRKWIFFPLNWKENLTYMTFVECVEVFLFKKKKNLNLKKSGLLLLQLFPNSCYPKSTD